MSRPRRSVPREGVVRDAGRSGDGVVPTDDGVVFVAGALPEERILFEQTRRRRGVQRGQLIKVLEASDGRVEPECKDWSRCGGCPWMIADASLEEKLKRHSVEHALSAWNELTGVNINVDWVPSCQSEHYRSRARLHWLDGRLGYRCQGTSHVQDIEYCLVLRPALQNTWELIRKSMSAVLNGEGEIVLSQGLDETVSVVLRTHSEQTSAVFDACAVLAEDPSVGGVALHAMGVSKPAKWGDPTSVSKTAEDLTLKVPPGGFTQANAEVNAALIDRVLEYTQPAGKKVLELYCGSGNLTVPLSKEASSVVAVEYDTAAAKHCQRNVKSNGLKAKVVEGYAEKYPSGRFDVVVLDPPRTGAASAIERIAQEKIKRVVYVSCDVATLSRDIRTLAAHGYALTHATALDMFPHTAHVETVVALELM